MDSGLDEPGGARVSSVSVKMRESGVFSVAGDISGKVDPHKSGEAGRGYQAEASADCLDMCVYKRVVAWSPRRLANGTTTRMVVGMDAGPAFAASTEPLWRWGNYGLVLNRWGRCL